MQSQSGSFSSQTGTGCRNLYICIVLNDAKNIINIKIDYCVFQPENQIKPK